jgi:transposase
MVEAAKEAKMEIAWLPFRSPELNPCEDLWRLLKSVIAANRAYASLEEEAERAVAWLDGLSNEKRLQCCGLQSSKFLWLSTYSPYGVGTVSCYFCTIRPHYSCYRYHLIAESWPLLHLSRLWSYPGQQSMTIFVNDAIQVDQLPSSCFRRSQIHAKLLTICLVVRLRLKRFKEQGLAGLDEAPRSGRPTTYTPEEVSLVIQTALSKPQDVGEDYAMWTLDRLVEHLQRVKGIPMKRSRISEIFIAEGLSWRHEETWFGERVDPDFARKRGPSKRSTRPLQLTV